MTKSPTPETEVDFPEFYGFHSGQVKPSSGHLWLIISMIAMWLCLVGFVLVEFDLYLDREMLILLGVPTGVVILVTLLIAFKFAAGWVLYYLLAMGQMSVFCVAASSHALSSLVKDDWSRLENMLTAESFLIWLLAYLIGLFGLIQGQRASVRKRLHVSGLMYRIVIISAAAIIAIGSGIAYLS